MCDDRTEAENEAYLARKRMLSRREMGMGAGAAVAAMVAGCQPTPPEGAAPTATAAPAPTPTTSSTAGPQAGVATKSRMVTIETPDGAAEAFFVAPESGKHPGVILWPDVAGLREAYEKMATRL
ncbi:MAG: hypothetical protein KC731_38330, partial [Myxococcales bacterium]|nr:hypothetical protein [Myxococcales bacterium]